MKLRLLLLLLIPVTGFSQLDTSHFVTWTIKRYHRDKKEMSFRIEGKIKPGFFIPPTTPCSTNNGYLQVNPTTMISITADSNWKVETVFLKDRQRTSNDYQVKRRSYLRQKSIKKDTVINGQKVKKSEIILEKVNTKDYNIDCRVYGKVIIMRGIKLSFSDLAIFKRNATALPEPEDETAHERRKRLRYNKKLYNNFTLPLPSHINVNLMYWMVSSMRYWEMQLPFVYR